MSLLTIQLLGEDMKLPSYEYNALFRPTTNWNLNAAVGENGGPYTFSDYAMGFFVAGHHIFKRESKNPVYVDVIVYPMTFNYRHGIELYLKSLLLHSYAILGRKDQIKKTHGIMDNWKQFRIISKDLDSRIFEPKKEVEAAERLLTDLCQIDPNGQVFRYPEDIKGNQHLHKQGLISIEVLYKSMKALECVFEKWSLGMAEVYETNPF